MMNERLKNLLADGRTKQVIEELKRLRLEDEELTNQIIQISARFAELERKQYAGTLGESYINLERNRINAALLVTIGDHPLPSLQKEQGDGSSILKGNSHGTSSLHIWVVSTIKNNYTPIKPAKLKNKIPHEHYHESDYKEWKPFKDENSIEAIITEYKSKVSFDVKERFLGDNPLKKGEESWLFKNLDKIILVIDPLALHAGNLKTISHFNTHKIGGCLGLICHCISFELFSYLRTQVASTLDRLQTCFIDLEEKYIHFLFPISTKEMFFRSLTNIAMVHINIGTQIEGLDEGGKIRNKKFNLSI